MLTPPSLDPLVPEKFRLSNGNTCYCFRNDSLDLVKLDLSFEAGSGHQWMRSQAHAANQLVCEASTQRDAQEVAAFFDFRGIVVERMADVCQGTLSFYFLRRYADELLPLLRELFDSPLVTRRLFESYQARRRQKIATNLQQTGNVARNRYYEILYGPDHPLGYAATVDDVDRLTLDSVAAFMRRHYRLSSAHIVLGGHVDDALLSLVDRHLSPSEDGDAVPHLLLPLPSPLLCGEDTVAMPAAVQSSVRIGRLLPVRWDDPEYARFLVLNTLLGGYFGSRLMSNLREDKGYTYGIYSQTLLFRGSIAFFIASDVAADATSEAVHEIFNEIEVLRQQAVSEEELERVRNYMMGDFIRSIDGTFEISDRYRHMVFADVDDRFTGNFLDAIQHTTSDQLKDIARRYLVDLVSVTAGPAADKGQR